MENLIEKYRDKLPESYLDFISKNKRFVGDLGDELGYGAIWDLKELHDSWDGYHFNEFLSKKWFPVGSNLGGEIIAIDTTSPEKELFYLPFITMGDKDAELYCANFSVLYDAIKKHLLR